MCDQLYFYAAPVTAMIFFVIWKDLFWGRLVILLIMHIHFFLTQPMFPIPPQVISTFSFVG